MKTKNPIKGKIIFASAECTPFAKVGGLADVVGTLPKALKEMGVNVSVIIPYYESIKLNRKDLKIIKKKIKIDFNNKQEPFNIWQTRLPESDVPIFLIENKKYFKGNIYPDESDLINNKDFEAARFFFFMKSVVKFSQILKINLIHCHDWHASLIPLILKKEKEKIKTILTIHNIAYQGIFNSSVVNRYLNMNLNGDVNCLQNGVKNADLITTVSPNYAKEILGPEFGFGLEKYLNERKKDLTGIINGIDPRQFSPEKDIHIEKNYSFETLENKKVNKTYLQKKFFKKSTGKEAIIGMISRIADQKGFDLVEKIFPELINENIQLIILGKGIKKYEQFFLKQKNKFPNKVFVEIGFDEKLAHQIYAGSDIFLMPSFFEPCGLGQMIALKYGTVPIVRSVGGLKDTVIPVSAKKGTGFLFEKYHPDSLLKEIKSALLFFKNEKKWKNIQENGMKQDFSWKYSAKKYLETYNKIL